MKEDVLQELQALRQEVHSQREEFRVRLDFLCETVEALRPRNLASQFSSGSSRHSHGMQVVPVSSHGEEEQIQMDSFLLQGPGSPLAAISSKSYHEQEQPGQQPAALQSQPADQLGQPPGALQSGRRRKKGVRRVTMARVCSGLQVLENGVSSSAMPRVFSGLQGFEDAVRVQGSLRQLEVMGRTGSALSNISDSSHGAFPMGSVDSVVPDASLRQAPRRTRGTSRNHTPFSLPSGESDGPPPSRNHTPVGPPDAVTVEVLAGALTLLPAADVVEVSAQGGASSHAPHRPSSSDGEQAAGAAEPSPPRVPSGGAVAAAPALQPTRTRASTTRVAWNPDVQTHRGISHEHGNSVSEGGQLPPLRRNSLAAVQQRVEEEIVRRHSKGFGVGFLARDSLRQGKAWLFEAAPAGVSQAGLLALHVGGIMPWRADDVWSSRIYQWLVLLVHITILAGLLVHAQVQYRLQDSASPFIASDLVLAASSFIGLVAVGAATGSVGLLGGLKELEHSREEPAVGNAGNAIDTLLTFTVWLAFCADRLSLVHVLSPGGLANLPWAGALHHAAVVISSAELCILVLAMLRVIRGMNSLIDTFCTTFLEGLEYIDACIVWNTIQASLRMSCRAIEWCFAVLVSALVLLALAMAFDIYPLRESGWALTAPCILILGISQILLRAASVTDSCVRISQLVNATELSDDPMDAERMYLVQYITASAAGFHVFNVRLGAGFATRVLHYTGLLTFTLARLVLPTGSIRMG